MAVCPKGHHSATADYCDVCGAPIAGAGQADGAGAGPAPAAAPGSAPAASPPDATAPPADDPAAGPTQCPLCGSARAGRFCERDGYDFVAAALAPSAGDPVAAAAQPRPDAAGWVAVVGADQAYFEQVKAAGGPDAGRLDFPRFLPERRFALDGSQVLIGRHSRSRGIYPHIDLVGPPEDPGVSHSHALLVSQAGAGWAVVDVGSSNGTYVNDMANPIDVDVPVPVGDGDRVYLGAWTVITIRRA